MEGQQAQLSLPVPGDLVDRYRILAKVAEGGMAAVFAVRRDHATFDKLLAMKLVLPHLRSQTRFIHMLADEARIAAHVVHTNVVQVFDIGEHEGSPFIVMEYLRGTSLANALSRETPTLSNEVLYGVLADIADGLQAAHEAVGPDGKALGIVHRDVSPQNAMLCFDGHVKLVDFGIAAASGRLTSTQTGEVKGKLGYVAPEQLHKRYPLEARADLWAFGVMAWQALARRPLFKGDEASDTIWNVLHREVPDLLEIDDTIPLPVVELIERCLTREPFDRPASAAECAEVLREACGLSARELRDALSESLAVAFSAERAAEEERTESLLRQIVTADASSVDPPQAPTAPAVTASPRGGWRTLAVAAAAGILVSGLGVAAWLGVSPAGISTTEADVIDVIPEVVHDSPPEVEPMPPTSELDESPPDEHWVELSVPDTAILVLVDGQRHDERPLRVDLGEAASAEVVTVGEDGETRTIITAQSDGTSLAVPTARARRSSRRRRPPVGEPAPSEPAAPEPRTEPSGLIAVPL